jgi:tetratricopeptide (TPR) repeat protein
MTVLQAKAPLLAARRFEQRAPHRLKFSMIMPTSYRQLLTEESGLTAYQVSSPADLPDELASPAWRRMSDAYLKRAELDLVDQAGLAHWLVAVCLHEAVLDVVPADLDPAACQDPVTASLQMSRAAALFAFEGLSDRTRAAYTRLTDHPAPTLTHMLALTSWGYLLARHAKDESATPRLLDQSRELLEDIATELSAFEYGMLAARSTLRAATHLERQGDFAGALAELTSAAKAVSGLVPADDDDELLVLEARQRLIDRQIEMAVRIGDTETERAGIEEGMRLDPASVKIHMQSAQAYERAGDHEKALAGYLHAARLGPFGTGFALLHAAVCARQTGHAEFARVLTERAFRAAPRATATRDALVQACLDAGDEPLAAVSRRAAVRNCERPFENNWHYQMYAAYFNLGESQSPCLYAQLPTRAFEVAERGSYQEVNWQRLMPPAFRRNLVTESGLLDFAVTHPADLPAPLRTPAWEKLCDWLAGFAELGVEQQHRVAAVLYRLGFGQLVLELIAAVPAAQLRTDAQMRVQHWRDTVRWAISVAGDVAAPDNSFAIARLPHCPTRLRFTIAVFAVVFHARHTRAVEEMAAWREMGTQSMAELLDSPELPVFEKTMMESRFYRSVSYVPFLRRDREQLTDDMNRAEELARSVVATSEYEDFLRRENLRACLESRSKEFYAFGANEKGDTYVTEVLAIDPYEPKSHIEMAESLLRQDRPRDAADSCLRTARLGPVSTALGYAAAADSFARAGERVLAEDCYLQVLRLDPYAISAARGWAEVSSAGPASELAGQYLADLEAWGKPRLAGRTS